MKKAIFLYDYTGMMAQPWLEAGYECWCFDGQHPKGITREGNLIKVGIWFDPYKVEKHAREIIEMVGDDIVFIFGFPECTDLAGSGAAHFAKKRKANPAFQWEAYFLALLTPLVGELTGAPWGFENPVGVLSTMFEKPAFKFHPYHYGRYLPVDDKHPLYPEYILPRDSYSKLTCIWSGNGFREPVRAETKALDICGDYSIQYNKLGGKSKKTKNIRSATPRGFAKAVFLYNN